jgi:hypothetical protein
VTAQEKLFVLPTDERSLADAPRTLLEAIDKRGGLTVRDAGKIVYQLRGFKAPALVRSDWLISAGYRTLRQLRDRGLVRRRQNLWVRSQ